MSGRAERYLTRVEGRLATLTPDRACRIFLNSEIEKWEGMYQDFRNGRQQYAAPGSEALSANDYALTLAGLNKLLKQYSERVANAA